MNYNNLFGYCESEIDKKKFDTSIEGMIFNNIDWTEISQKGNLSSEFIDKYAKFIDWASLLSRQNVPMSLVRKHEDDINWDDVNTVSVWIPEFDDETDEPIMNSYIDPNHPDKDYRYQDELFDEFEDKFEWDTIQYYQIIPEKYLLKYAANIDWEDKHVVKYQLLTEKAIEELIDRGYIDKSNIDMFIKYQHVSDELVLRHIELFRTMNFDNNKVKLEFIHTLAENPGISEQFILDHHELVAHALTHRPDNSDEFINKCFNVIHDNNSVTSSDVIYHNKNISDKTIDILITELKNNYSEALNNN